MVNTMMMERYKSLGTQILQPIILDELGEEAADVNYQQLWDDEVCDDLFDHADDILMDQTGSWLDWWPRS